jgi:hypothetical protein
MLLRVKALGLGTSDDPYHADLPNYQTVVHFPERGYMLVRVRDTDVFPRGHEIPDEHIEASSEGPSLRTVPEGIHEAMHDHLDSRYGATRYRPVLVPTGYDVRAEKA